MGRGVYSSLSLVLFVELLLWGILAKEKILEWLIRRKLGRATAGRKLGSEVVG